METHPDHSRAGIFFRELLRSAFLSLSPPFASFMPTRRGPKKAAGTVSNEMLSCTESMPQRNIECCCSGHSGQMKCFLKLARGSKINTKKTWKHHLPNEFGRCYVRFVGGGPTGRDTKWFSCSKWLDPTLQLPGVD